MQINKFFRLYKFPGLKFYLHILFCFLYGWHVKQEYNLSLSLDGDQYWITLFSYYNIILIISSFYLLSYGLYVSFPDKVYLFIFVSILVYCFHCFNIYYWFEFLVGTPQPPTYVQRAFSRMGSHVSGFSILFNNQIALFSRGVSLDYIIAPLALKGIYDTFNYYNKNLILQKANLDLELSFLRSQINPHFLFNTLNNIYSMVEDTNPEAAESILKLSHLMSYTLYETGESQIPLNKEIKFISDYIELERIRHDENIQIHTDFIVQLNALLIAPLITFAFIENAFKHGINASVSSAYVKIRVQVVDTTLIMDIENSRPQLEDKITLRGIGLRNVKKRLQMYYPKKHILRIIDEDPSKYQIHLEIELQK